MSNQALLAAVLAAGLTVGGSGCCCVGSCCNSGSDFGGAGCTSLCGSQCEFVAAGSGGCGGGCRASNAGAVCTSCTASVRSCGGGCGGGCGGCSQLGFGRPFGLGMAGYGGRCGWGYQPEVFVDEQGQPCFGPMFGLARWLRDSFTSCGCGARYIDEWVSDPPLCNDPCDEAPGCGCGGSGGCTCGAGIAEDHYAKRKYNWGQRSRVKTPGCSCGTCGCDDGLTSAPAAKRVNDRYVRKAAPSTKQVSGRVQAKKWGAPGSQAARAQAAIKRLNPLDDMSQKIRRVGWFE